jgi:hypothetical protein
MSLKRWFSHQIYAIQQLKVNLIIMQVVWNKNRICRGRSPLAFLNTKILLCSSALAHLKLPDFRSTAWSSTRSKHRAQHMQSRQTRTTKNNTPSMKSFKERTRVGSRNANTKALGTIGSFGWSQTRASYVIGIF